MPLGLVGGGSLGSTRSTTGGATGSGGGANTSSASSISSPNRTFAFRFASRNSRKREMDLVTCASLPAPEKAALFLRSARVGPRTVLAGGSDSWYVTVVTERESSGMPCVCAVFFSRAPEGVW